MTRRWRGFSSLKVKRQKKRWNGFLKAETCSAYTQALKILIFRAHGSRLVTPLHMMCGWQHAPLNTLFMMALWLVGTGNVSGTRARSGSTLAMASTLASTTIKEISCKMNMGLLVSSLKPKSQRSSLSPTSQPGPKLSSRKTHSLMRPICFSLASRALKTSTRSSLEKQLPHLSIGGQPWTTHHGTRSIA